MAAGERGTILCKHSNDSVHFQQGAGGERAYSEMTMTATTAPLFPTCSSVTLLSLHMVAHSAVLPCVFKGGDKHTFSTSSASQLYAS
eukprot:9089236-Ditylum_brightwellii.AAC.1